MAEFVFTKIHLKHRGGKGFNDKSTSCLSFSL